MSVIIAFAGRKQSGKTSCSSYIQNFINKTLPNISCAIYNFADPLKQDICMNILGLTYKQCYGEDIDKNTLTELEWNGNKLTAREVMQFIGTDIFRKIKNDVWASATIKKIQNHNPDIALVADCRFPNEVEAIRNANGYIIKLMRDPFHSDHISETALDPNNYDHKNFDLVIDNRKLNIYEQNLIIYNFLIEKGILPL
jgi:hypothetical protein